MQKGCVVKQAGKIYAFRRAEKGFLSGGFMVFVFLFVGNFWFSV
jgi:hypothetical protein